MERIRKALQQAERDRSQTSKVINPEGSADDTAELSSVQEPLPQADVESRSTAPANGQAAGIRFKQTRIVDVPADLLERNRLVAALPEHELSDSYRILRTRVLQSMNSNHWNTLAITSPATGCGKTLTAANLAISLAREVNRTVLLADFDMRSPSIHKIFGYEPELGLSDYLFGDASLEDILFSPSIERLVVLPGRASIHNSAEALRSPKMVALVEELKARYKDRFVIFDLAPILAVDDALAFSPYTDAMLMVAENGATKRDDLKTALEALKDTPIIGTVLNKSQASRYPRYGSS